MVANSPTGRGRPASGSELPEPRPAEPPPTCPICHEPLTVVDDVEICQACTYIRLRLICTVCAARVRWQYGTDGRPRWLRMRMVGTAGPGVVCCSAGCAVLAVDRLQRDGLLVVEPTLDADGTPG